MQNATLNDTSAFMDPTSFTDQQITNLLVGRTVTSGLSIIGNLLIIIFMIIKNRNDVASRLFFYLSVASLCLSISYWLSLAYDPRDRFYSVSLCTFQGWVIQFSNNAILSWSFILSFYLLYLVKKKRVEKSVETNYHLVVWIWSIFSSTIPFIISAGELVYDLDVTWCWFPAKYKGYQFGLFYGPYLFQLVLVIIFYGLIFRMLGQVDLGRKKKN